MIYFLGAGPGAPDLITVRGRELLRRAHTVVYAGSLINPLLLKETPSGCQLYNSAGLTLEEVVEILHRAQGSGRTVIRLHSGDPSLYGAIREQMDALAKLGLAFEVVPGVSSLGAVAAALGIEYTVPGVSQTVILTRLAGRTPVPAGEEVNSLAAHGASMVFFLSSNMLSELCLRLEEGGYPAETPAALVYKASWPEEKVVRGTIETLPQLGQEANINSTALVVVGNCLGDNYELSRLYAADFTHSFRPVP